MLRKSIHGALILLLLCALPASAQRRDRVRKAERIRSDASHLAAVLDDLQYQRVRFTDNVWRTSANEALALANRLYDETGGRADARNARAHIRQMRTAVLRGNLAAARNHAQQALPYVHALSDWAYNRRR
ncbi:MAG TPA: hypothetical protein VL284_04820 [Thermoanaerobaculia bacterium]|nr:hypothetical protein [Thermoanaerobaculia bacterium]